MGAVLAHGIPRLKATFGSMLGSLLSSGGALDQADRVFSATAHSHQALAGGDVQGSATPQDSPCLQN